MTTDPTADLFVPPAAEGLPLAALDSATVGADRLDAVALTPTGRNFLAHALVQLARDGWLRTEPGEGFEAVRDREAPEPLPTLTAAPVPPSADRATLLREAALNEAAAAIQDVIDADRAKFPRRSNDRAALGGARQIVLGLIDKPSRVAAEQPTETHSCRNCEGIDPDTCLMNPEQPAVGERPDTQTPEARVGRCSAVMMRVHHAPHGWEPQPGMDPVDCPGYPQPAP